MPRQRNAFKLGVTLIVLFVLTIGVLLFLAPEGAGDMKLKVRFLTDEIGVPLKPGDIVACGGVVVGSIESVQLREMKEPESGARELYALIGIIIDSGIELRRNCVIVPEGTVLGGGGKLTILERGDGKLVQEGDLIDGQEGAAISTLTRTLAEQLNPDDPTSILSRIRDQLDAGDPRSLVGKIHASLDDLNGITESLDFEISSKDKEALMAQVHSILDHVNRMTALLRDEMDNANEGAMIHRIHTTLATLDKGLTAATGILEENREPIAETVKHVEGATRLFESEIAARIAAQLDVQDQASLLAKVHVSLDRLNQSLADVQVITDSTREMIVLNKEQINRTISNVKATSDNLKATSADLRRNPWRLLYKPTPEEVAQSNVYDASREFAEAARQLDDVVLRLQGLVEAGRVAADDQQLIQTLDELSHKADGFNKAEKALWRELDIK